MLAVMIEPARCTVTTTPLVFNKVMEMGYFNSSDKKQKQEHQDILCTKWIISVKQLCSPACNIYIRSPHKFNIYLKTNFFATETFWLVPPESPTHQR